MIILVGSKKGGVGKSTIATNIATNLAIQKKDVVLVDADKQGTSSNWADDREHTNNTQLVCVQKYENIKKTLQDLDSRYDYVIVDCHGGDAVELRSGLLVADILIIPCQPSQPDIDTMPMMVDIIERATEINEKLRAYCVITRAPTNPSITEIQDTKNALTDFTEIKLLNSIIYERKAYRDAISLGLGVIETDNDKAKTEIENMLKEIFHG
jgi:chromosome partitioning protein